ncbi:MAG TPA: ABC transporter ATP-binding protein [Longimicrobiales bacterium]|nr:ABC transporter ATP-binding protein [Longimicrobiales bacterium]
MSKKRKINLANVREEAWALVVAHKRPLLLGLALMFVGRLAGFVLPASSRFLIDTVIGDGRTDLLWPLAGAAALATLIQAASSFGLSQVVSVAAQRAIRDLRASIQAHVIHLPVRYFDSTKSGALISRIMNDPEGIRNLVGTGVIQLVGGSFTSLLAMSVLLWVNWRLTLGAIGLLVIFAGIMAYAFRKLRPIFRERWRIQEEVAGRLGEAMGGVRLVKVYVAETREQGIFADGVDRLFRNVSRTITGTSAVSALSSVIVGAVGVLIMIVGTNAVVSGSMTLGLLVMYVFFVGMLVVPLVQIASIGTQISEAFAGLDRMREIRDMKTEDSDTEDLAPVTEVEGDVAFNDVTFGYADDTPVLHDVSFHAPAGTTTALVGPSGSGKSTLINLVMAFHNPQRGEVRVDGRDLSSLRVHDYRSQLGVVLQDNFLFDGTIRDNIAYARPQATDEDIRVAARIAHCDEFVSRFENGYDTIVGERGVKLSGGQRQRVAIARAILADPRILILDEATSSLDSESEALIQDGLRALRAGRTTFVIAHRLSTIRSADRILVLDGGRIVERGTHADLLAIGGLYRRLYERQRGLETDLFINPGEDPVPGSGLDNDSPLVPRRAASQL